MIRHLLGKNLKNFLTNTKDNLKTRCHSKMILGHTVFKLSSASIFSLKLPLLLNNSIS